MNESARFSKCVSGHLYISVTHMRATVAPTPATCGCAQSYTDGGPIAKSERRSRQHDKKRVKERETRKDRAKPAAQASDQIEGQEMGSGKSSWGGGQDFAQLLRRFREVDGAYQSASDPEKEQYFPRRHAALMMILGIPPRTRDEISEIMGIAIDELARDLMVPGPLPAAVATSLTNCLRAIDGLDVKPSTQVAPPHREPEASDANAPSDVLIEIDLGIDRLGKLALLLGYLAKNCGGKDEQGVFQALMNSTETIKNDLSTAVDKLTAADLTRRSHANFRR